jgi:hypothetical protein
MTTGPCFVAATRVPPLGVDAVDDGSGAVEQAEAVVVAQCQHHVAPRVRPSRQHHLVGAELALGLERATGSAVEIVDVGEPEGDHKRVLAAGPGVQPLLDQ